MNLCLCCYYSYSSIVRFFFFKQKTAYEMRISDWSSDVCSSDLSRANLRKLSARANDIPGPGEPLDRLPGDMVLVRNGSSMFAASQRPVSRDEYARFASATGREPAR